MQSPKLDKLMEETQVLHIEDLSVSRSGKVVISDINLKILKGEFIDIDGALLRFQNTEDGEKKG